MKKSVWKSRTFWVNAIVLVALVVNTQFGFEINAEAQTAIVVVINLIMRAITSEGLTV